MEALLIHPQNAEQLTAVKAVLKALKVPYEPQAEFSFPNVTKADLNEAYQDMRDGKYTVVKAEDLWK